MMKTYFDFEIRRHRGQVQQTESCGDDDRYLKWNKLRDLEYVQTESTKMRNASRLPLAVRFHVFAESIHYAKKVDCSAIVRWHLLIKCSYYLICARDKYQNFDSKLKSPLDLQLIRLGFTLPHYVTELEFVSNVRRTPTFSPQTYTKNIPIRSF